MRILVVSADPSERLRATSGLLAEDDVVESGDVDEARRFTLDAERPFDVLIVDGDLDPRGGYAFLYELRAHADLTGWTAPPSIVLTSRSADVWLAGWAGASELFLKPVDPFEVAAAARAIVGTELPPYGDAGSARAQVGTALRRSGR